MGILFLDKGWSANLFIQNQLLNDALYAAFD